MKSIIQGKKECLICGTTYGLHLHHIYFGPYRQVSDRNGFTCYLCAAHHIGPYGVHYDPRIDREIKRRCQSKYEETHTRKEFMALIGRNYIDD